jgi:hypothetical protein
VLTVLLQVLFLLEPHPAPGWQRHTSQPSRDQVLQRVSDRHMERCGQCAVCSVQWPSLGLLSSQRHVVLTAAPASQQPRQQQQL